LRNAFSYVAKAGNGSVATDFIDFRALLPEPSRQERISNLLAAAELTECLGEAGFFPESNLTEVLGDWEKTVPEGYTRSYFPESNLTNLATLVLAEDRCANESAGGSEGETWQAVCSPWLELLLPRSLSVIEPLLGFFGDIAKMARSQLTTLEEIMAQEAQTKSPANLHSISICLKFCVSCSRWRRSSPMFRDSQRLSQVKWKPRPSFQNFWTSCSRTLACPEPSRSKVSLIPSNRGVALSDSLTLSIAAPQAKPLTASGTSLHSARQRQKVQRSCSRVGLPGLPRS